MGAVLSEKGYERQARRARRGVEQQYSIRGTNATRQLTGSSTRRNDTYFYSLLKSLDLLKDIVEFAVQALQVGPHRADKASQEGRKEKSGKDILVGPADERQKAPFNESGQGASVDGAHECVVRFAYNTVKMGVMWFLSTAASDEMNEEARRIALGMGMVTLDKGMSSKDASGGGRR